MEKEMLTLLPGVRLTRQGGRYGLTLGDCSRYTASPGQAALLQSLAQRPQRMEDLKQLLAQAGAQPENEAYTALMLAEFILEFGDYLAE